MDKYKAQFEKETDQKVLVEKCVGSDPVRGLIYNTQPNQAYVKYLEYKLSDAEKEIEEIENILKSWDGGGSGSGYSYMNKIKTFFHRRNKKTNDKENKTVNS